MTTLDDFNKAFANYGYVCSLSRHDLDIYGRAERQVEGVIIFHSLETFLRLVSDVDIIKEYADEQRIRESDPRVKRAYEEYRLLLKLST